jgi:nucleoside-diphosphate-sugar epimerase
MRTAVIGGGLVGSQIVRLLAEAGGRPVLFDASPQREALAEVVDLDRVDVVQGDVRDLPALAAAVRSHRVTRLVHTAANPLLGMGAQQEPHTAIAINVMGTANVLEVARTLGLGRVVLASTSSLTYHLVGGDDAGDPRREEAFPRPLTIYATTKQACESLGLNYARWFGVDVVILRFAGVVGPWRGRGGGGPSNLFREAVERAFRGEEAAVPATTLEWLYSKDAAEAARLALETTEPRDRVFNVGMGRLSTPADVVAALRSVLPGARVGVDARRPDPVLKDQPHAMADTRARAQLGYAPRYDLAGAIRDWVEWLRGLR